MVIFFCRILGTPDAENHPDIVSLPHFKPTFPKWSAKSLEDIFPNLDANGINLMSRMLSYDPNKRITAKQALLHVKFYNEEKC
jgi:serine/threonine protein kinase